jgi:hypothetical protein
MTDPPPREITLIQRNAWIGEIMTKHVMASGTLILCDSNDDAPPILTIDLRRNGDMMIVIWIEPTPEWIRSHVADE